MLSIMSNIRLLINKISHIYYKSKYNFIKITEMIFIIIIMMYKDISFD